MNDLPARKVAKTPFLDLFGPSGPDFGPARFFFNLRLPEIESPHIDQTKNKKSDESLELLARKMTKTPFLGLFGPPGPDFGPAQFFFNKRLAVIESPCTHQT